MVGEKVQGPVDQGAQRTQIRFRCHLGLVESGERKRLALCPIAINKLSTAISLPWVRVILKQDWHSPGQIGFPFFHLSLCLLFPSCHLTIPCLLFSLGRVPPALLLFISSLCCSCSWGAAENSQMTITGRCRGRIDLVARDSLGREG